MFLDLINLKLDLLKLIHKLDPLLLSGFYVLTQFLLHHLFLDSHVDNLGDVDGEDDHIDTDTGSNEIEQVPAIIVTINRTGNEIGKDNH